MEVHYEKMVKNVHFGSLCHRSLKNYHQRISTVHNQIHAIFFTFFTLAHLCTWELCSTVWHMRGLQPHTVSSTIAPGAGGHTVSVWGRSGSSSISLAQIEPWWALNVCYLRVALVGGRLSDWACHLLSICQWWSLGNDSYFCSWI